MALRAVRRIGRRSKDWRWEIPTDVLRAKPPAKSPPQTLWKPNMGPFRVSFNQSRANRVVTNVGPFFAVICLRTNPMIKVVALPWNSEVCGRVAFPILKSIPKPCTRAPIKRDQGMKVIGHEKKYLWKPGPMIVIERDRREQLLRNAGQSQLLASPDLAIDGNKEGGVVACPVGGIVKSAPRLTLRSGIRKHGTQGWI